MEVFRDLFIRGDTERLIATMDEIERRLSDGWSRDRETEMNLSATAPRGEPTYCFACDQRDQRPAAIVFITQKEPGVFYVPNIVPRNRRELSYEEYNGILVEFCDCFVRPAAERTSIHVDLTDAHADLGRW